MSADQIGSGSSWPTAPPTSVGPLPPAVNPAVWPTVIGVIAIVFGAFGVLAGLWGVLAPLVMRNFETALPSGVHVSEAMSGWEEWTLPLSAAATVLAALLLAGGVGLVQLRPWGRRLLMYWAPLKIMLAGVNGILVWHMQAEMLQVQGMAWTSSAPFGPAGGNTAVKAFSMVSLALALVWGAALPVFVLIWFARATIREQVAKWGATND
jgi:hypothetical protein